MRAAAVRVYALAALAVLALTVSPAAADEPSRLPLRDYVRRTWTTVEGLPQNSVRAIVQADEGFLWLATSEGPTRFDGARTARRHAATVSPAWGWPSRPGSWT